MAESAKRSKQYPGRTKDVPRRSMTAKMARGTVTAETRLKREKAEAKRQAATEGAGGGKARGPLPKQGKGYAGDPGEGAGGGAAQKRMTRGGQEMPTGGGGPGPKRTKKAAPPAQEGPQVGGRLAGSGKEAKFGPPHSELRGGGPKSAPPKRLGSAKAKKTAPDVSSEVGVGRSGRVPRTLAKPGVAKFEGPPGSYRPKRGVTRSPSRRKKGSTQSWK